MKKPFTTNVQAAFSKDFTTNTLKAMVIAWACFVIVLAIFIDNPWVLAGILAYEVLP